MSKLQFVAKILNVLLLIVLMGAITLFISFFNVYGMFLACVTAGIGWGVFKHLRWGYFAAAAWGLACYQLAKQGYEFESIKRQAMIIGFTVVPVALFLHEILGKSAKKTAQNNGSDNNNDPKMPD